MRPARPLLAAAWIAVLVLASLVALDRGGEPIEAAADELPPSTTLAPTSTTALPTTVAPVTTTVPPTTTTTSPPPPPGPDLSVYRGLGTWVDVYDWSETFNRYAEQRVGPADVDRMADAGIETLYIQTSKWDAPTEVLEPERLLAIIERAEMRGIDVVAWYLPTFENPQADMGRLMAATRLPGVDALAVDIESLRLTDVVERNRRLLQISRGLRDALPGMTLGAIPYPPVVTDVINPSLWPGFPWAELGPLYDVWLPMSYQSDRKPESGYRDAYRYTAENIDRMRARLGRDVPVHTIGGIADRTSPADVGAMLRAAVERRAIGGSLYDWKTTGSGLWSALQGFRSGR